MRRKVIGDILDKVKTSRALELGREIRETRAKHDSISKYNVLKQKEKKQLKNKLEELKSELRQSINNTLNNQD